MSDKHPKSKLKRKKCTVEESRPDQHHSTTKERPTTESSRAPLEKQNCKKVTDICSLHLPTPLRGIHTEQSPPIGVDAWWDQPSLCGVERLWALTLKSLTPHLEPVGWSHVPDLPLASAAKSVRGEENEWRWCCLGEDVSSLSKPLSDSCEILTAGRSSHQLQPSHLSAVPEKVGFHVKQLLIPSHEKGNPDSPSSQEVEAGEGSSRQIAPHSRHLGEDKRRGQQQRAESAAAGESGQSAVGADRPSSSTGADSWRRARACEEDGAVAGSDSSLATAAQSSGGEQRDVIRRQIPASCAPAGESGGEVPPEGGGIVSGKAAAGRDSGGGGGLRLECCPMCLMPFPAGFTQMDCDGHLAHCLSDMNTDMVW